MSSAINYVLFYLFTNDGTYEAGFVQSTMQLFKNKISSMWYLLFTYCLKAQNSRI